MIYISWDIECDKLKLVILGHFLPFYPALLKILKLVSAIFKGLMYFFVISNEVHWKEI